MKKTDKPNQPKTLNFWLCGGLLALLLASTLTRDITRPFYGLHSWGEAHAAWMARSHLKYGFGYTKGFDTFAVGNPPAEKPTRYLDHPQLRTLLDTAAMFVFGINTWSLRAANIIATILSLLFFLKILRGLLDDKTALLAGLLFCLFPLTGYFGVGGAAMWIMPTALLTIWCYLVVIQALKDGPQPKKSHKYLLAILLFAILQVGWEGFFYALAIGVHYVARCIHRRQLPDKVLLAILIIAPLSSLALDFVILIAGRGWDMQGIIEVYKWRSGAGERGTHIWSAWFAKLWEFAVLNFTLPILITAIGYLTLGQLLVFAAPASDKQKVEVSRWFPQFWLFLMPAIFQLFLLKGALWPHQYWERPLAPFIAIAAALGVMLLYDVLKKANQKLAVVATVALVGAFFISCMIGTNYYYAIRWQQPAKIEMFKMLNQKIPPDEYLLSFEHFIVDQYKAKQASYRPEIAWYLDREIVVSRTTKDIEQKAKTGKYPYYIAPEEAPLSQSTMALVRQARAPDTSPAQRVHFEALYRQARLKELKRWERFIGSLKKLYEYQQIPGVPGQRTKDGKFLKVRMTPYLIFDLNSTAGGN